MAQIKKKRKKKAVNSERFYKKVEKKVERGKVGKKRETLIS